MGIYIQPVKLEMIYVQANQSQKLEHVIPAGTRGRHR
jgi:hypothetical protein